ncbi:MAG: hypothetical protein M1820_009234 [Bogoriella megaspora]|nr:MAG: hypothetical protein M1820_009234 [Bogoriella megaspora]
MRAFSKLVLGALASLIGSSLAAPSPLIAHPGTAKDVWVTKQDTINATQSFTTNTTNGPGQLTVNAVNNFAGTVNAYVTGLDSNNQLVILQTDGTWLYPSANGATTPQPISGSVAIPLGAQGSTTAITLPSYISAGRIWFAADGELKFFVVQGEEGPSLVQPSPANPQDPSSAVNWGFVELTYTEEAGLWTNISYVDFVGLILGMSVTGTDGTVQSALGLQADALNNICNDLKTAAAADGQPWDKLCVADTSGKNLRAMAPGDYSASNPDAFSNYWTDYVNQVWQFYETNTLTVDTQASAGKVTCQVSGGVLNCNGDSRGYNPPVAADIWGCNSGPFAIEEGDNDVHRAVVPRLCAAFTRSTLLATGGDVQPGLGSTQFYLTAPTNVYSQVVHKYEVDGKGYAFAYDDVSASSDNNQSGELSTPTPQSMTVTIGGPSQNATSKRRVRRAFAG